MVGESAGVQIGSTRQNRAFAHGLIPLSKLQFRGIYSLT
jgi:hypothetical protein